MSKKNIEEAIEVTEEETVETVENENTELVAAEEPKEKLITKIGRGIKKNGPKVAKLAIAGAATVAAFALGIKVGKGSNKDGDIVDADYEVLDDDDSDVTVEEF